jgi:hypothetical protein
MKSSGMHGGDQKQTALRERCPLSTRLLYLTRTRPSHHSGPHPKLAKRQQAGRVALKWRDCYLVTNFKD